MAQDDGWQTVDKQTKKRAPAQGNVSGKSSTTMTSGARRGGLAPTRARHIPSQGGSGSGGATSGSYGNSGSFGGNQGWKSAGSPSGSGFQGRPKNVVAKASNRYSDESSAHASSSLSQGLLSGSSNDKLLKKEAKPRKPASEYGWTDLKQLRRLVAHLEAIANYSKGGIIGSLRMKTIHNSEDREQDVTPISEIKLNAQEDAFLQYIASTMDHPSQRPKDVDVLLGFMSILLTCISHIRYYNQETHVDNYWTYHEKFTYDAWKMDLIPTNVNELILRELHEKLQAKPMAIDRPQLQGLLNGRTFPFRYNGNLSVPFCLNAMKEHINCNQSKLVSQRRRLYRYEHKSGASRSGTRAERATWTTAAAISKDYKAQVEQFEKSHMGGAGAPVLGLSSMDSVLHSIYTSFLKIKKRETPDHLLDRLKKLLIALPNLIDLPELLQGLNPTKDWCGYPTIDAHPDLGDYKELKRELESFLEREGVTKRSSDADPIKDTLTAIYEFNHAEDEKLDAYLSALEDPNLSKGYPLLPKYLKALLSQLALTDEEIKKYEPLLRRLEKLNGLTGILSHLKRSKNQDNQDGSSSNDDDASSNDDDNDGNFYKTFDEMSTMEMD